MCIILEPAVQYFSGYRPVTFVTVSAHAVTAELCPVEVELHHIHNHNHNSLVLGSIPVVLRKYSAPLLSSSVDPIWLTNVRG